jgi:hypothetical protein
VLKIGSVEEANAARSDLERIVAAWIESREGAKPARRAKPTARRRPRAGRASSR